MGVRDLPKVILTRLQGTQGPEYQASHVLPRQSPVHQGGSSLSLVPWEAYMCKAKAQLSHGCQAVCPFPKAPNTGCHALHACVHARPLSAHDSLFLHLSPSALLGMLLCAQTAEGRSKGGREAGVRQVWDLRALVTPRQP